MPTEIFSLNSVELPQISRIVSSYLKRTRLSSWQVEDLSAALHKVFTHFGPDGIAVNGPVSTCIQEPMMSKTLETKASVCAAAGQPAVAIEASVHPDFLICLEDGAHVKSLALHLKRTHGLTPEQYRRKWGLPIDYPMISFDQLGKKAKRRIKPLPENDTEPAVTAAPVVSDISKVLHPQAVDDVGAVEEPVSVKRPLDKATHQPNDQRASDTPAILNKQKADSVASAAEASMTLHKTEQPADMTVPNVSNTSNSSKSLTIDVALEQAEFEEPTPKQRSILRLSAWKTPAMTVSAEQPQPPQADAAPVQTPALPVEETSAPVNTPPKSANPGFRYPVNRYSR